MTTAAVSAFGTTFNWDTVTLDEVFNISGPSESADTLDVTSHDSADGFKEYIAGLKDGGEVNFEANLIVGDSTGQIAMHTDFQAGSAKTLIITLPGSTATITGTAICTKFEFTFPHDGPARISGTVKFTGKPVLAVA